MAPKLFAAASLSILFSLYNVDIINGFQYRAPALIGRKLSTNKVASTIVYSKKEDGNGHDEQFTSAGLNDGAIDRRSFTTASGLALSTLLLSSTSSSFPNGYASAAADSLDDGGPRKRILITGSNSGIGLDAAMRMASRGHEVVLACRTMKKANDAAEKVKSNIINSMEDAVEAIATINKLRLTPVECDLADLKSIDKFVTNWKNGNGNRMFDAVCYNAGLARNTEAKEVLRTKQGFELTVGTNHLGHFYLNHLLLPLVNPNGGRIVVTASGVHDPDSPGGAQGEKATLGDLSGLEKAVNEKGMFDMVDGGEFNADKAYKDSKLCNVFFTRELQRRLNSKSNDNSEEGGDVSTSGSGILVNCFNPGLIVSTGLFRDQNKVFTKLFDFAATDLLKVGETVHWGGGTLEYMTLSSNVGKSGGGQFYSSAPGSSKFGEEAYGTKFRSGAVSKEAMDDEKGKKLWELSEKLVGI